jgi:hypothetical protein
MDTSEMNQPANGGCYLKRLRTYFLPWSELWVGCVDGVIGTVLVGS